MLTTTPTILLALAIAALVSGLGGWLFHARKARGVESRYRKIQSNQSLELDQVYSVLERKKSEIERLRNGDMSIAEELPHPLEERRQTRRYDDDAELHAQLDHKDQLLDSYAEQAKEANLKIKALTKDLAHLRQNANKAAAGNSPLTTNKGPEDEFANELRARDIKIKMLETELSDAGVSSGSLFPTPEDEKKAASVKKQKSDERMAALVDEHEQQATALQQKIKQLESKTLEQQQSLITMHQQFKSAERQKFAFAGLLKNSAAQLQQATDAAKNQTTAHKSNVDIAALKNALSQSQVGQLKLARKLDLHRNELKKQTQAKLALQQSAEQLQQQLDSQIQTQSEVKQRENLAEETDRLASENLASEQLASEKTIKEQSELKDAHSALQKSYDQCLLKIDSLNERHNTLSQALHAAETNLHADEEQRNHDKALVTELEQQLQTERQNAEQNAQEAHLQFEQKSRELESLQQHSQALDTKHQQSVNELQKLKQHIACTPDQEQSQDVRQRLDSLQGIINDKEATIASTAELLLQTRHELEQLKQQQLRNLNEYQTQKDQLETRLHSESNKNRELAIVQHRCRSLESALEQRANECARLESLVTQDRTQSTVDQGSSSSKGHPGQSNLLAQISNFQQANSELAAHANSLQQQLSESSSSLKACQQRVAQLENARHGSNRIESQISSLRAQYQTVEALYRDLQQHNRVLLNENKALLAQNIGQQHAMSERPAHDSPSANQDQIDGQEPDDLKLIFGIGPVIEKILHDNGIIRFEQIATLDGPAIDALSDKLGAHSGRILRDDWTGCATKLLRGRKTA